MQYPESAFRAVAAANKNLANYAAGIGANTGLGSQYIQNTAVQPRMSMPPYMTCPRYAGAVSPSYAPSPTPPSVIPNGVHAASYVGMPFSNRPVTCPKADRRSPKNAGLPTPSMMPVVCSRALGYPQWTPPPATQPKKSHTGRRSKTSKTLTDDKNTSKTEFCPPVGGTNTVFEGIPDPG